MSDCGCHHEAKNAQERRVLKIALVLNAVMAVIGGLAGWIAQSTGLLADALDMLSDATAYAIGLVAIGRTARFKANAAWLSGSVLLVLGIGVLVEVGRRVVYGCHFQKTTARNIRSQPHDLLRCQLGRPLTNPKSQANVGVRNTSCYALHPG